MIPPNDPTPGSNIPIAPSSSARYKLKAETIKRLILKLFYVSHASYLMPMFLKAKYDLHVWGM